MKLGIFFLRFHEEQPCWHLGFGLLAPELGESEFPLFKPPACGTSVRKTWELQTILTTQHLASLQGFIQITQTKPLDGGAYGRPGLRREAQRQSRGPPRHLGDFGEPTSSASQIPLLTQEAMSGGCDVGQCVPCPAQRRHLISHSCC